MFARWQHQRRERRNTCKSGDFDSSAVQTNWDCLSSVENQTAELGKSQVTTNRSTIKTDTIETEDNIHLKPLAAK